MKILNVQASHMVDPRPWKPRPAGNGAVNKKQGWCTGLAVAVALFNSIAVVASQPDESLMLTYKGHQQDWQFVNGSWQTNDAGDLIIPTPNNHNTKKYMAFYGKQAYRDFVISGKWRFLYGGGASPQLMIRAQGSRQFYSIMFTLQVNDPRPSSVNVDSDWQEHIMVSIWKGTEDGFQHMLGYRRKVCLHLPGKDPTRWHEVRVECIGPEILVFAEDNFVCAIRDDEYQAGLVGVGCVRGRAAWKDLSVQGRPVQPKSPWNLVPDVPRTGEPPPNMPQSVSRYLPSIDEYWMFHWEHKPGIEWHDDGTNFDELNMGNFWNALSRSTDGGKTWSEKKPINVPFPEGRAYAPIKGKAGSVLIMIANAAELSDGSIGCTAFWRNSPDGNYTADQVFFARTTDRGETWSLSPVDATEWERNESTWVELADGELLCLMRSNYECYLAMSRSTDRGETWSRCIPAIPFFSASGPTVLRTRDNVLILGVRIWGLVTSLDNGHTWSMPTNIGSYTGGDPNLLREMPDGRILVRGPGSDKYQFITVDREGVIHAAP